MPVIVPLVYLGAFFILDYIQSYRLCDDSALIATVPYPGVTIAVAESMNCDLFSMSASSIKK